MTEEAMKDENRHYARRSLIAAASVMAVIVAAAFIWTVGSGLLVLFICILLAVIFDAAARLITRYTGIGRQTALGITVALLLGATVVGLATGGVGLFEEMPNLGAQLDRSVTEVNTKLSHISWIRSAGGSKPVSNVIAMATHAIGNLSDVATLTLGAAANLFVVFVVGLYLAWTPKVYANALICLFPQSRRPRMHDVLNASGQALRRWILGQMAAMAMVFVLISTGLLVLGVNMAIVLGVIAGLLTFVPYLGGIIAAVPAILIGFLDSPLQAAWVALLFLGSYIVEGYFFTPLVQQRTISIAPAFLLIAQLLAASFSGIAGIFVAAPLTVVVAVLVQMLYLQDVLHDSPRVLGSGDTPTKPDADPYDPGDDDVRDSTHAHAGIGVEPG